MYFGGYAELAGGRRPRRRTEESVSVAANLADGLRRQGKKVVGADESLKGVVGRSPLLDHPGFDMVQQHLPDLMHIGYGVVGRHLFPMISKDRLKNALKKELERLNRVALQNSRREEELLDENSEVNKAYQKQLASWKAKERAAQLKQSTEARNKAKEKLPPRPTPPTVMAVPVRHDILSPCSEFVTCWHFVTHHLPCLLLMFVQIDRSRLQKLEAQVEAWTVASSTVVAVETRCWPLILAPPGVVPTTARPFTNPGELNCAHWLSVAQVTGKYLLSQLFQGQPLEVLCKLLDFTANCLALDPEITQEGIEKLTADAKGLAADIDRFFPSSEWSLVLHMLVFHVPKMLEEWGPARGTWCFAYERSAVGTGDNLLRPGHFATF
jgi:hypothetical protein